MMYTIFLSCALALVASASPLPSSTLISRQAAGCKKVTFIFARGSTEPGTMGMTVGPAFSRALEAKFGAGSVASQGVSYPASIAGAMTGGMNPAGAEGAVTMAKMAKDALTRCPQTKVVLGGYSQGAEQVHGALARNNLGADGAKIAAAVTYGDPLKNMPNWGSLPKERTMIFCASGDGVCGGAFAISAAHLSYTSDGSIQKGVNFVTSAINAVATAASAPRTAIPGAGTGMAASRPTSPLGGLTGMLSVLSGSQSSGTPASLFGSGSNGNIQGQKSKLGSRSLESLLNGWSSEGGFGTLASIFESYLKKTSYES